MATFIALAPPLNGKPLQGAFEDTPLDDGLNADFSVPLPPPQAQPSPITPELHQAITAVAERAAQAAGLCPTRLAKAVALALSGAVTASYAGFVEVRGESGRTYLVSTAQGVCGCEDYRRGHRLCKHRLAAAIWSRATALLRPLGVEPVASLPPRGRC